jgi:hypothetical protein
MASCGPATKFAGELQPVGTHRGEGQEPVSTLQEPVSAAA